MYIGDGNKEFTYILKCIIVEIRVCTFISDENSNFVSGKTYFLRICLSNFRFMNDEVILRMVYSNSGKCW